MSLVLRSLLRYWRFHRLQLALCLLGVALGVAVVVGVQLASQSALRGFELSVHALDRGAKQRVTGGPRGLDQRLWVRLFRHGLVPSAPRVEGWIQAGEHTLKLVGVAPLAEATLGGPGRPAGGGQLRALLTEPDTVLMTPATAAQLGIEPGRRFAAQARGTQYRLRLVGELPADAALSGVVLCDIGTAQRLLDMRGRLSAILFALPADRLSALRAMLPPEARLSTPNELLAAARALTGAFRLNLFALSLLALLVGGFLIFNTLRFAVLQRQGTVTRLRAVGVSRRMVLAALLAEAGLLGIVGGLAGSALGLGLAQGLLDLIARTINDLYFGLTVRRLYPGPALWLGGVGLAVAAAVLAALPPAWEAAGWPPRGAGEEAGLARQAVRRAPQFALLGVACMLAAGLLTLMAGLVPVFAGIFLFILGAALATPWLVGRVLDLLQRGRVGGLAGRLALAEARGGLDRMGVAAAALAVAVAAGLGVGLMVNSFRSTVADWLGQTLNGDLYVSADGGRALPPAFVRQVGALPGLDALHTGIRTRVDAAGGPVDVLAIGTPSGAHPAARLKSGQPDAWSRWQAGAVLISEPLSRRRHLAPGDTLRLRTAQGWRAFPIVGVYYDYNPGPGRVLMARAAYARYWRDDRVLTLGLYLRHGVTLQAMQERLRTLAARDGLALDVRSNRAILANALHTFDQTFAVTRALRLLVLLVAFAGVFSGLMALLLERSRVHATLRALGLTPAGVFGLLIGEAALIGLCAGLIALPLGAALAWALVELVNPRAFGWSLLLHFQAPLFGQTLLLALGGALLASLYPALRLARTPPARALRSA